MKIALTIVGFVVGFFVADLVISLLNLGPFSSTAATP
jgi:hypothetical protein